MSERYDLTVIGAGSGGLGAALAAARLGLNVLLVEKADMLGGNAVRSGVSLWEPVIGATGVPFDIYRRLKPIPNVEDAPWRAVGIYSFGRHFAWPNAGGFPGGEHVIDPRRGYLDTLRRHGSPPIAQAEAFRRERLHGVIFEPDTYAKVVEEMLAETGRCAVLKNTGFASVQVKSGRVVSLRLDNGADVEAAAYVDATADGLLCLACGCEAMMGQEARTAFNEPHAPEHATHHINGLTLIYRITPTDRPGVEPLPPDVPSKCWWRSSFPSVSCVQYPCGDRNMNMLPTMEGAEFLGMSYSAAYAECRRRVLSHWHHCQTVFPEFQRYRLSWIAPALGVRETRRIKGEYVLTEHDLRAGLSKQTPPDIVALADHSMDTHGAGSRGTGELAQPYGIPYRCLIPKGFQNLLIACRAASFSSLAASSCRLSRTMMQLGQAAGTAAALALRLGVALPAVPPAALRDALRAQHVQLDWPMPDGLRAYLG